jgi:hypothetical protein
MVLLVPCAFHGIKNTRTKILKFGKIKSERKKRVFLTRLKTSIGGNGKYRLEKRDT